MLALAFSPAGDRLYCASRSLQHRCWRIAAGDCVRTWKVITQASSGLPAQQHPGCLNCYISGHHRQTWSARHCVPAAVQMSETDASTGHRGTGPRPPTCAWMPQGACWPLARQMAVHGSGTLRASSAPTCSRAKGDPGALLCMFAVCKAWCWCAIALCSDLRIGILLHALVVAHFGSQDS